MDADRDRRARKRRSVAPATSTCCPACWRRSIRPNRSRERAARGDRRAARNRAARPSRDRRRRPRRRAQRARRRDRQPGMLRRPMRRPCWRRRAPPTARRGDEARPPSRAATLTNCMRSGCGWSILPASCPSSSPLGRRCCAPRRASCIDCAPRSATTTISRCSPNSRAGARADARRGRCCRRAGRQTAAAAGAARGAALRASVLGATRRLRASPRRLPRAPAHKPGGKPAGALRIARLEIGDAIGVAVDDAGEARVAALGAHAGFERRDVLTFGVTPTRAIAPRRR